MRKKFSAIIVCFLIVLACTLSGCAGFYRNDIKYYNKVVIKVGDYNITQFDLDNAYNNYGYAQYVNIGYMQEDEARKQTEESLVNGQLLYKQIKNDPTYTPTIYQLNQIASNVIDSVISQMQSYLASAKSAYGVITSTESTSQETTETQPSILNYKRYTQRATLVSDADENDNPILDENGNVTYHIEYNPENSAFIPPKEPTANETVIAYQTIDALQKNIFDEAANKQYINDIINEFKTKFKNSLKNEQVKVNDSYINVGDLLFEKSISLMCDDLIDYEYYLRANNKNYSTKEADLLYRYFKRNVDNQIQNQYINNFRTNYLRTHTNELDPTKLIEKWRTIVKFNKQYQTDQETYKNKMKDISTDGDSILYHPVLDDGTKFGYFIHILLESETENYSFSDAVKTAGDDKTALDTAVANMRISVKNLDGSSTGKMASINDIQTEYNNMAKLNNYTERLNAFIRLMFKYSSDPGLLSGGMPYVVGTNGFSGMNEPFTNEAIGLMEGTLGNKILGAKNVGNVSEFNSTKYDDLCVALNGNGNYGIHLIMFIEDVGAYDVDANSLTIADLKREINPLTHETYFDMLFDKVYPAISETEPYSSNNGYADYENTLIENSKLTNKVVHYK